MNPRETMCQPHREALNCKTNYMFVLANGLGHFSAEYAGMFKTQKNKKQCFLDIGQGHYFKIMSLDFGNDRQWSESNFVLIDGELAPFQPQSNFDSIPSVNFKWLSDQNITLSLLKRITTTGFVYF